MAELIATLKGREVQRFAVMNHAVLIGRAPQCDLVLPNESVSREHATISFTVKGFSLMPMTETNSVWLNGKLCTRATSLSDGDRVQLGKYVVQLSIHTGPPLEVLRAGDFETASYTSALAIEELERYREPAAHSGRESRPLERIRQDQLEDLKLSLYQHRVIIVMSGLFNVWLIWRLVSAHVPLF